MNKSVISLAMCSLVLVATGCRTAEETPIASMTSNGYAPQGFAAPTVPYPTPALPSSYANSPYAASTGQPYGNPSYPPSASTGYATSPPGYPSPTYPAAAGHPYGANPYASSAGPAGYSQVSQPEYERSTSVSDTLAIPRDVSSSSSSCPSGCNNH